MPGTNNNLPLGPGLACHCPMASLWLPELLTHMSHPHSVSHLGYLGPSRPVGLRAISNQMRCLKGRDSPPPKSHSEGTSEIGDGHSHIYLLSAEVPGFCSSQGPHRFLTSVHLSQLLDPAEARQHGVFQLCLRGNMAFI